MIAFHKPSYFIFLFSASTLSLSLSKRALLPECAEISLPQWGWPHAFHPNPANIAPREQYNNVTQLCVHGMGGDLGNMDCVCDLQGHVICTYGQQYWRLADYCERACECARQRHKPGVVEIVRGFLGFRPVYPQDIIDTLELGRTRSNSLTREGKEWIRQAGALGSKSTRCMPGIRKCSHDKVWADQLLDLGL